MCLSCTTYERVIFIGNWFLINGVFNKQLPQLRNFNVQITTYIVEKFMVEEKFVQ